MTDPYITLDLPHGASDEEIYKAYRKLVRQWHPDKNASPEAKTRFQEIKRAFETLSDPVKRLAWEFNDVFSDQGARLKKGKSVGSELVVRRTDTACVSTGSDGFSWTAWAESEDFSQKLEKPATTTPSSTRSQGKQFSDFDSTANVTPSPRPASSSSNDKRTAFSFLSNGKSVFQGPSPATSSSSKLTQPGKTPLTSYEPPKRSSIFDTKHKPDSSPVASPLTAKSKVNPLPNTESKYKSTGSGLGLGLGLGLDVKMKSTPTDPYANSVGNELKSSRPAPTVSSAKSWLEKNSAKPKIATLKSCSGSNGKSSEDQKIWSATVKDIFRNFGKPRWDPEMDEWSHRFVPKSNNAVRPSGATGAAIAAAPNATGATLAAAPNRLDTKLSSVIRKSSSKAGAGPLTTYKDTSRHEKKQVPFGNGPANVETDAGDQWMVEGLTSDPSLDLAFQLEFEEKQSSPYYQQMKRTRRRLPAYEEAKNICQTIDSNQVTVIEGETGCGKTTQIPQFILDDFITRGQGSMCRIVCTQPRRISAITVGRRVAQERAEKCGGIYNTVGYQIKLESERPRPRGSITFCTPGIVLKWLENDPLLTSVSHLILDEVHERELHTDFLLIITKDILPRRPDLKLVLMSATLNTQQFSDYYGGCPILKIPGRTFPVEEYFLEDVVEELSYRPRKNYSGGLHVREKLRFEAWVSNLNPTKYNVNTRAVLKSLYNNRCIDLDLVVDLIRHISSNKAAGAILVFMPGWEEISAVHDKLNQQLFFQSSNFLILPLHGSMMSTEDQQKVFEHPPEGVRKIVISTNIAETSITMDDVVYVIDCGKIKIKNFDAKRNVSTLQAEWNSRANSEQRKGRAGRVQRGVCYHLYTRYHHKTLVPQHKPEMLRMRLENISLQIKLLNRGRILEFFGKAMQRPEKESVERAIEHLINLNALDEAEELTPLGYHLARMPVDPHLGKMIIFAALFGCLDPILTIAACLEYKTPFFSPMKKRKEADEKKIKFAEDTCSDHLMFVNAFNSWLEAKREGDERHFCWENFLSAETLQTIKKNKQHLADQLFQLGFISEKSPSDTDANIHSQDRKVLKAVVCAGLYPNVGKINTLGMLGFFDAMMNDVLGHDFKIETAQEEIHLHPKSVNCGQPVNGKYLVYFEKMHTSKVYIHDSTVVSYFPLLLFATNLKVKQQPDGQCVIMADPHLQFAVPQETVQRLKEVRQEFSEVLEEKYDNPGPTDWSPATKEGRVMTMIVKKIKANKE